jgi:hypothetical protein
MSDFRGLRCLPVALRTSRISVTASSSASRNRSTTPPQQPPSPVLPSAYNTVAAFPHHHTTLQPSSFVQLCSRLTTHSPAVQSPLAKMSLSNKLSITDVDLKDKRVLIRVSC